MVAWQRNHTLDSMLRDMEDMLPDDTGVNILDHVPATMHIAGTKLDACIVRFDSLTYPELYVEIDTRKLKMDRVTTVKGRFSDSLFYNGVNIFPQAQWTVEGSEFTVFSPGRECVFNVQLT